MYTRYATNNSGKYMGFGLKIREGTKWTTIADVFNITQKIPDTGVRLKVDDAMEGRTRR